MLIAAALASATSALAASQRDLVSARTVTGVSTTIVADGKIALTSLAGVTSLENGRPVTARTLFRIGSITKMFTAVSIMQLVESDAIRLDDPLSKYVSDFPNSSAITVRELLMHRSGIPNYLDAALSQRRVQSPTTPLAIVSAMAKEAPESKPGSAYSYSNTNYVLLGLIVERVSGLTLHEYYAKHIFSPAAMRETFAPNAPAGSAVARGYELSTGNVEQNAGDMSWYYACGDILSTSEDLARFDIALMGGKLLSEAAFASMIDASQPADGKSGYGLGIMTFPFGDLTIAGHHGGLPGFEADNEMIPAHHFAVITLGNDFLYPTSSALNIALNTYYPAEFSTVLRQAQTAKAAAAAAPPSITPRLTMFFENLLAGKFDPNEVTAEMTTALTPAMVVSIRQSYSANGPFKKLVFTGADVQGLYHRYHYSATFAKGSVAVVFVIDADEKVAGFFNG